MTSGEGGGRRRATQRVSRDAGRRSSHCSRRASVPATAGPEEGAARATLRRTKRSSRSRLRSPDGRVLRTPRGAQRTSRARRCPSAQAVAVSAFEAAARSGWGWGQCRDSADGWTARCGLMRDSATDFEKDSDSASRARVFSGRSAAAVPRMRPFYWRPLQLLLRSLLPADPPLGNAAAASVRSSPPRPLQQKRQYSTPYVKRLSGLTWSGCSSITREMLVVAPESEIIAAHTINWGLLDREITTSKLLFFLTLLCSSKVRSDSVRWMLSFCNVSYYFTHCF